MKVIPLTLREANDFVERWHRHSARTSNDGGKYAIGLEHNGELVGAAIVGRPTARLLQQGRPYPAELLRLVTSPVCPKGGGSKLYARAKLIWQMMGGVHFSTCTLTRESGATMRGVGFRNEDAVECSVGQHDRPSRKRKFRAVADEPKQRWTETLPELPL